MPLLLGLFGGTFDPIHEGHLFILRKLSEQSIFSSIEIIPCGNHPPHRPLPVASAADRLTMIQVAITNVPYITINDLEIRKQTTSYTLNTVQALRHQQGEQMPIVFILSTDAFTHFNRWHQWQQILDYCHLLVIYRKQYWLNDTVWLNACREKHEVKTIHELQQSPYGKLCFISLDPPMISASHIRQLIREGNDDAHLLRYLPHPVLQYIRDHRLYG